jgi:two-component system, cell cycle sensor histidine kinase and response regulator CckA
MGTVLVLEDDPSNMQIFSALLRSVGYRVLEATSGSEAVRFGRDSSERIDLLLSDILLPDCSGTQVALELMPSNRDMAILFISGTPISGWNAQDLNNLRRLPPERVDFLEKPFRPAALLDSISRLLGIPAPEKVLTMRP